MASTTSSSQLQTSWPSSSRVLSRDLHWKGHPFYRVPFSHEKRKSSTLWPNDETVRPSSSGT